MLPLAVALSLCLLHIASPFRQVGRSADAHLADSHDEAETSAATLSELDAAVLLDTKLQSRFEIQHLVWRQNLETRRIEHMGTPKAGKTASKFHEVDGFESADEDDGTFEPEIKKTIGKKYMLSKRIDEGVFGEAFSALDRTSGRNVILKVIIKRNSIGIRKFVTWAEAESNPRFMRQLEKAAAECSLASRMQLNAHLDQKGASRLMKCYEDHVTLCEDCPQPVGKKDILFLVLEDCTGGAEKRTDLGSWLDERKKDGSLADANGYLERVMSIFKQVLEALQYMTAYESDNQYKGIGFVHHDLKPENIVIKAVRTKQGKPVELVKLIDFGGTSEISPTACEQDYTATLAFTPPEFFVRRSNGYDCYHPGSFDIYSTATILNQLVTGSPYIRKLAHEAKVDLQVVAQDPSANNPVKKIGGIEDEITAFDFREMLYKPDFIRPMFDQVTSKFDKEALRRKWYDTYFGMLAFEPMKRPYANIVLGTKMMAEFAPATYADE